MTTNHNHNQQHHGEEAAAAAAAKDKQDKDDSSHMFSRLSISTSSCHEKARVDEEGFEVEASDESDDDQGLGVCGSLSLPSTPTTPSRQKSPRRRRWSFVREREKWREGEEGRSESLSKGGEGTGAIDIPARESLDFNFNSSTAGNGNSPISNWGISSPGDDPKEVKERLKEWAHAVALVSTSPH